MKSWRLRNGFLIWGYRNLRVFTEARCPKVPTGWTGYIGSEAAKIAAVELITVKCEI